MQNKFRLFSLNTCVKFFAGSVLAVAAFYACSSDNNVAGGVSEETNTVAGILVDAKGKPVVNARVLARHTKIDSIAFEDTTSSEGKFAFPLLRQGVYGISASADSLAFYATINYEGKNQEIEAALTETASFEGCVVLDAESLSGIEVYLPGSGWKTQTDSLGKFKFEQIPVGSYAIVAQSPDPARYLTANYMLQLSGKSGSVSGPIPMDLLNSVAGEQTGVESGLLDQFADSRNSEILMPLSSEYGLVSWWPMDYISASGDLATTADARGRTEAILLYDVKKMSEGVSGKALSLGSASQFGVIENDHGALDSLTEMTLEAVLKIDSLVGKGSYRKNIVGKLGFGDSDDRDVFSLAVVNGECGADKPSLAFFLADGSGDSLSCANAVVAKTAVEFNEWTHVVVVWSEGALQIYLNGKLDNQAEISVKQLESSDEPIFFGKEDVALKLDDVRLGAKAITSADVLYRYYLRGGAL
ncbi:MAG: hypothetical protein MJZ26_12835 [Fibrobacter sp.]|nr:hypothetical protein [Fibrobacter sp.]